MGKRKGGGARRGPFAGKRVSFATRLTDETMEKLVLAAEKASQSLSQKAEEAILMGLRREEDFHRYFGPALAAFEDRMGLCLPGPDIARELKAWEQRADRAVDTLANDLHTGVRDYASDLLAALKEQPSQVGDTSRDRAEADHAPKEQPAEAAPRTKRDIQID